MENNKNRFVFLAFDNVNIFCSFVLCMLLFICSPYYSIIFRGIFWWLSLAWGLGIFIYHATVKKDVPWKEPSFIIALVFHLAINLTCLINGAFGRYGLGYMFNAFFAFACFLPFENEDKALKKAFPIAVAGACLYSIVDMVTFASTGASFSFRATRPEGIWGNPNGAGMFVAVALMFLFYLALNITKLKYKILLGVATLVLLMEMMLSGCRNAILGLAVTAVVVAFCYIIRCYATGTVQQKKLLSIILVALMIVLLVFCFSPVGRKTFDKVFAGGTSGRDIHWQAGLHYASKHLLFGSNQIEMMQKASEASEEIGFSEKEQQYVAGSSGESTVHNCFIHILMAGGLVSLIPYILLVIMFYVKGFSYMRFIKSMDLEEFHSCMFYATLFTLVLFMSCFESFVTSINVVPVAYYFAYGFGIKTFDRIEKKYP